MMKLAMLVAVLGKLAVWLMTRASSGYHTPPALTDRLHALLLWSIKWLEQVPSNALAIDSIPEVGIAGAKNFLKDVGTGIFN